MIAVMLTLCEADYLVQAFAYRSEQGIRQGSERVLFGATQTPIEGLGLVAKHITGLPGLASLCRTDGHGEWVVGVVGCRGHGQPDDQ